VLSSCLKDEYKSKVSFLPSSQITQSIEKNSSAIGLIPVMDLINHKELYVSDKYGISFEAALCNSYIYYSEGIGIIEKISLSGDVSSQEAVLSKIIFKEMYGSDIDIEIITNINKAADKNLLIIGDENFLAGKFLKGISFAEIMIDTLSLPFVNYVFASGSKKILEEFINNLDGVQSSFYEKIEKGNFDSKISNSSEEYIKSNISSFIFKFDEQDRKGIEQILRLPYFHRIIPGIVELNFV
jgi:hypothetical protein